MKVLSPVSGPKGATRGIKSPALGRKEHRGGILRGSDTLVLIDGEKFVHRAEEVLRESGLIKSRKDLRKIDYGLLFGFAKKARKNYYSTILRAVPKNHVLYRRVEDVRLWQRKWVPYMISQGVNYVRAGYLRARDGKECAWCGKTTDVLVEKGVDVRIAVDMVEKARKGMTFYLVSSDTDLLPAIESARRQGARVVYVAFEQKVIKLISVHVDETIVINNKTIVRAFKEVR